MQDIIIYNTPDGRSSVALYAKDGNIWLNQGQIAELFATSKPNISLHISNILKDNELDRNSVAKNYLTTATDGKEYNVEYYSLPMIIAIGYRVRGARREALEADQEDQSLFDGLSELESSLPPR